MSENIFASGAVSTDERNERARRAVKNFRAMQYTLTGYARAITGRKDVSVQLATGTPRTDGTKIYFKPPMALGDNTPHERRLCDKRDPETLEQRCPACQVREEVLILVIHEIAHIAFGTFEEVKPKAVVEAMDRAIKEVGTKYAKQIEEVWDKIPDYKKADYLNLSGLVSPFLPILVNALEDARVDEAMFAVRKGTRAMFDALTMKIFREGIEEVDGSVSRWSERPLNSQALIGVFVLCCGYNYKGWFSPEVEVAMADDQLRLLCAQVDTIRSAEGTYNLAFPILARLRELGFCRSEQDPEDEEPDTQENTEDEPSEDDTEAPEEEPSDDPSDDESGADESGDDESADGSGDPDDDLEADTDAEGSEGSDEADGDEDGDPEEAGSGAGDSDEEALDDDSEDGESADGSSGQDASDGSDDGQTGGSAGDDGNDESTEVPEDGPISGDDEGNGADGEADPSDSGEGGPEEGSSEGAGSTGLGDDDAADDGERDADGEPEGDPGEVRDSAGSEPGGSAGGGTGDTGSDEAGADDDDRRPDGDDDSDEEESLGDPGLRGPEDGEGDDGARGGLPGEPSLEDGGLHDEEGSRPDSVEPTDERVDTLADDGMGGDKVDSNPNYGDADQAFEDVFIFNKHEVYHGEPEKPTADDKADDKALDMAIMQGGYFETTSVNVAGVREHSYNDRANDLTADAWNNYDDVNYQSYLKMFGADGDLEVEESVLAPVMREMRRVFADNKRSHMDRNRKDGKVNSRVLGKRAPFNDPRLFQKKRIPGKRDYAVLLGLDVSGSTIGENLHLIKRAAKAQAELLDRMGIPFAVYAHSGSGGWGVDDLMMDIYCIKDFDDPWDSPHQEALDHLCADAQNLDGHTLEYYRRRIERVNATDRVIMYYTDGKMPAENHDEELEILQREIKYCRSRGIHLMGVGIRTDSPVRHGLPTVQVDDDEDLVKVIRHLESGLLRRR